MNPLANLAKILAVLLILLIWTMGAHGAEESGTVTLETSKTWYANPSITGGYRSYNDLGRQREFDDPSGRRLKSRNEFFFGVKTASGWGVYGQAVETAQVRGTSSANSFGPSDPSLSISHPVLETERVKITGTFREYFPVSNFSVANNQWQQAYYSYLLVKLRNRYDFENLLIPRYFSQSQYAPGDTTFYTEDFAKIMRPVTTWCRLGFGQHSQVEFHPATATGTTVDLYPFADFMITPQIYASPRIYLPVYVSGSVFDSATNVSTSNIQAELYVQATL